MQWLTNGLSTLSNAKLTAFIGVAAALCIAGSFGGGYLVGSRNEARIQTREVLKTVYVPVREIQEVQVRNVERERVLEAQLATTRLANREIRERLDLVAADNHNLNARVVGLLNEAITGTSPPTDPTSVPAGSTTTVTDLTDWAFDATVQYNELAIKHNALIDWIEEELIEPQRTGD